MPKYTTVKVDGVIIAIGKTTNVKGYAETVLESLLPTDRELDKMSQRKQVAWTKKNNAFMETVCKLMNDHDVQY
jgi:hypothetical protein